MGADAAASEARDDGVTLECVVLGPASRRRGRDYGLRAGGRALSGAGRRLLEDFALALSEWAIRAPSRPFATLLWLGENDQAYVLLRGAFLGRGEMGPVAVAQGLLIPPAAMARMRGRAHRLLDLIEAPSLQPWAAPTVHADAALIDAKPEQSYPRMHELGAKVIPREPWGTVVNVLGKDQAAVTRAIMDWVPWVDLPRRPAWASTRELPSMGSFSPEKIGLFLVDCDAPPTAIGAGEGELYTDGTLIWGEKPPSPGWILLDTLFRGPKLTADDLDDAGGTVAISENARVAMVRQLHSDDYEGIPLHRVVVRAFHTLAGEVTPAEFWDAFEMAARNIDRLQADQRAAAAKGISMVFESMSSDPVIFASALNNYVERIWDNVIGFPPQADVPLKLLLERDVLGRIDAGPVEALMGAGLAVRFPAELAEALGRQRRRPAGDPGRLRGRALHTFLHALDAAFEAEPLNDTTLPIIGPALALAAIPDPEAELEAVADQLSERAMAPAACALAGWAAAAPEIVPPTVRRRAARETDPWMQQLIDKAGASLERGAKRLGLGNGSEVSTEALTELLVLETLFPDPALEAMA
jgi:hypothetical protein